jgi:prolyl oligopeptidase
VLKRWRRGTPLSAAETVFEGETQDVAASVMVDRRPGFERTIFSRALDFYRQASFLLQSDGRLARLTLPDDAQPHFWGPRLLISLRSDWEIAGQTFAAGSLLLADAAAFLAGARDFTPLFTPTPTRSLADYTLTREHLILNISDKVASRLEEWDFRSEPPRLRPVQAPFPGTLSIVGLHDDELVEDALAERYLLSYTDFLTPDTLSLAQAGTDAREPLKARLPQFDASGMRAEQFFAQSADGTAVPYFVIWPAGARPDGANPTLLYGYGGFEVSMQPWYSGGFGRAWYSGGGVLVLANIRGGGEFGPAWHQAAILDKKQRSYDDFIAVAEDLIARGITRPRQLGIMGGSNGGLLVGAVTMQRPELFHAVVCQVPLLDMRRYHQLLAGASWMAEYGNPDEAADWASIARYSPYQNVAADRHYPKMLFTTSTRDDRVHPGHARKMAARMLAQGHEILYYENIEGGHGGAADNEQRATLQALEYSYLWQQLARPAAQALGQSRIAAERGGLPVAAQQVLSFWFGPPGGPDEGQPRAAWFSKDPAFDAEIRERFGALIEQALEGGLRDWDAHGASGALARILLLDQFTRNSLRDTARAFAGDALALRAALTLLDAGGDRALTTLQRVFAYLPLEHAEDLALQHRSVALFEALAAEDAQRADALDYARRHLAVIERFGRFPHRNAALGRTSTPEELDYLAQPGAGF